MSDDNFYKYILSDNKWISSKIRMKKDQNMLSYQSQHSNENQL